MTLKELKEEMKDDNNKLVLDDFNVAKLHGVIDGKDDFYWILQEFGGRYYYKSCVMGYGASLYKRLSKTEYKNIENTWKINEPYWDKNHIKKHKINMIELLK